MFKFCPSCTKETAPGWKCCPYCGFKFGEERSVESKEKDIDSTLDDAIGNLLDLAKDRQTEDKMRVLIIRGKYDEARQLCDELIDKDPMDKVGYIGLIRIASQNYKVFEGEKLEEDIRIAQEIFGEEGLLNDAEYANFESAHKQFLEEKALKLKEEENIKRDFEIEDNILKKYKGSDKNIIIPNGVTSIGDEAFHNCSNIISVEIPSSVTSIGGGAFKVCINLTSIDIPSSVTRIGDNAFYNCSSLTSIEIPSGITRIGDYAFCHCTSLASIDIPKSVTSIGGRAFYNCSSLTNIVIPRSVTSIGYEAFGDCSSLTNIGIPSNVTSIGSYAFRGCSSLTRLEIPSSVTSIGDCAFSGCDRLTSIIVDSNNTKYRSDGNCIIGKVTNILIAGCNGSVIPKYVTSIGDCAFCNCNSLISIEIPSGVTSIGVEAFGDCSRLTSIDIPSSVISIGEFAFYSCSSLKSVTIPYNCQYKSKSFPSDCKIIRK